MTRQVLPLFFGLIFNLENRKAFLWQVYKTSLNCWYVKMTRLFIKRNFYEFAFSV